MAMPEGQQSAQQSQQQALKATLSDKIFNVADSEKQKLRDEKKAACDYVRSDPLGILEPPAPPVSKKKLIAAPPPQDQAAPKLSKSVEPSGRRPSDLSLDSKSAEALRPESREEKKQVRFAAKKKTKEDDIFKSFGKEHDQQAVQTVDGKLKVNYKRFWNSDPDLNRWTQSLAANTRHDALMFEVMEECRDDYRMEVAELTQQHNALFRQRYAVEQKELHRKPENIQQVKDMQKRIAPKVKDKRKPKEKDPNEFLKEFSQGFAGLGSRPLGGAPPPDLEVPPNRCYGEEQIVNFIGFLLTHFDSLESAFKKIDENRSNALSYAEFTNTMQTMGYRGDAQWIFKKVNTKADGTLSMDEFLQLEPYMFKEMVRVLQATKDSSSVEAKQSVWLNWANSELENSQLLLEAFEDEQPSLSGGLLKAPKAGRAGSSDSSNSDSSRLGGSPPSTSAGNRGSSTGNMDGDNTAPLGKERLKRSAEWLPQVPDIPVTLKLFVFRNGDRASTGEAIFVGKVPQTFEQLLRICAQTVKPVVGPVDCLLDLNLQRVRGLNQVQNGGTYLLKGKEALDPPPVFFVPRPPLEKVRFNHLCKVQMASHCEANSRAQTPATRPNTSASNWSKASGGSSLFAGASGSAFSEMSTSRVGSPPEQSPWGSLFSPPQKRKRPLQTWQVSDHLRKELTYGGKNMMPVHKRYDLWKVLPRSVSEPSIDLATQRTLWSTNLAEY